MTVHYFISIILRHIDGNHKLIQPYRVVIHGGIDGYSRLIVFLKASANNRASTVLNYFQEAVAQYNLPSRVRTDLGLENIEVARFMVNTRGVNRGSIITGTSVHNQRIERLWREVNSIVCSRFQNIFACLESFCIDTTNEKHLFALHVAYIPLINEALEQLTLTWNFHSLSTEHNLSPRQLWIQGMLNSANSGHTATQSVLNDNRINWDEYGIDEDGPVPQDQTDYIVEVPLPPFTLSEEQVQQLEDVRLISRNSGDADGIVAFFSVLHLLEQFVQ